MSWLDHPNSLWLPLPAPSLTTALLHQVPAACLWASAANGPCLYQANPLITEHLP